MDIPGISAQYEPFAILGIGISLVLFLIIVLRTNAFLALISAAIVVSLLAPGEVDQKIKRVADAFGTACGKFAIIVGLAAIIGEAMMLSGAADRIVRSCLRVLGEKRAGFALLLAGFILAIPVFFDTVFYLMIPLARSLYRQTGKNFVHYTMAIAAGGAATHTLVPPTPGPLSVAVQLDVSLGRMILVGLAIAAPTALLAEFVLCRLINRLMPIPMRPLPGLAEPEPFADDELPSFFLSVLPIILPVILISGDTVVDAFQREAKHAVAAENPGTGGSEAKQKLAQISKIRGVTAVVGDPNLALLFSTAVALAVLVRQRKSSLAKLGESVETALMSAGVIILITAAGGAFGGMLSTAGVGDAIKKAFTAEGDTSGLTYLLLAYGLAAVLKVAQGSSTVAMITTAGLFQGILAGHDPAQTLGFDPVYLATSISAGSLMGSWMNDSGFWVFAKMSGFTEKEGLLTWSILLAFLSIIAFVCTLIASTLVPLV